jgi:hypothetical protein
MSRKTPAGRLSKPSATTLVRVLPVLHPDRVWLVRRGEIITRFDQNSHLSEVDALVRANPQLRVSVGWTT